MITRTTLGRTIALSIVLLGCGVLAAHNQTRSSSKTEAAKCGAICGRQVVRAASDELPSTNPKRVFAMCPSGKKVLGGGAVVAYQQGNSFPADPDGSLYESEPTGGYDGWQASAIDRTPNHSWAVIAYAVCANVE